MISGKHQRWRKTPPSSILPSLLSTVKNMWRENHRDPKLHSEPRYILGKLFKQEVACYLTALSWSQHWWDTCRIVDVSADHVKSRSILSGKELAKDWLVPTDPKEGRIGRVERLGVASSHTLSDLAAFSSVRSEVKEKPNYYLNIFGGQKVFKSQGLTFFKSHLSSFYTFCDF